MKIYLFFTCLLFSTIILNAQSKNLSDFNSLSTSGNVKVELIKSENNKAEYTITKGKAEDLLIEVSSGVLTVRIKAQKGGFWSRSETKANVKIYFKTLSDIEASSGSSVSSSQEINIKSFSVKTSSGASCQLKTKTEKITAQSSSGSSLTLSGSTTSIALKASSGSTISAAQLTALEARADASSGASINLSVEKSINAEASSGASIKYKGNPTEKNINANKMSGGSIQSY